MVHSGQGMGKCMMSIFLYLLINQTVIFQALLLYARAAIKGQIQYPWQHPLIQIYMNNSNKADTKTQYVEAHERNQ